MVLSQIAHVGRFHVQCSKGGVTQWTLIGHGQGGVDESSEYIHHLCNSSVSVKMMHKQVSMQLHGWKFSVTKAAPGAQHLLQLRVKPKSVEVPGL